MDAHDMFDPEDACTEFNMGIAVKDDSDMEVEVASTMEEIDTLPAEPHLCFVTSRSGSFVGTPEWGSTVPAWCMESDANSWEGTDSQCGSDTDPHNLYACDAVETVRSPISPDRQEPDAPRVIQTASVQDQDAGNSLDSRRQATPSAYERFRDTNAVAYSAGASAYQPSVDSGRSPYLVSLVPNVPIEHPAPNQGNAYSDPYYQGPPAGYPDLGVAPPMCITHGHLPVYPSPPYGAACTAMQHQHLHQHLHQHSHSHQHSHQPGPDFGEGSLEFQWERPWTSSNFQSGGAVSSAAPGTLASHSFAPPYPVSVYAPPFPSFPPQCQPAFQPDYNEYPQCQQWGVPPPIYPAQTLRRDGSDVAHYGVQDDRVDFTIRSKRQDPVTVRHEHEVSFDARIPQEWQGQVSDGTWCHQEMNRHSDLGWKEDLHAQIRPSPLGNVHAWEREWHTERDWRTEPREWKYDKGQSQSPRREQDYEEKREAMERQLERKLAKLEKKQREIERLQQLPYDTLDAFMKAKVHLDVVPALKKARTRLRRFLAGCEISDYDEPEIEAIAMYTPETSVSAAIDDASTFDTISDTDVLSSVEYSNDVPPVIGDILPTLSADQPSTEPAPEPLPILEPKKRKRKRRQRAEKNLCVANTDISLRSDTKALFEHDVVDPCHCDCASLSEGKTVGTQVIAALELFRRQVLGVDARHYCRILLLFLSRMLLAVLVGCFVWVVYSKLSLEYSKPGFAVTQTAQVKKVNAGSRQECVMDASTEAKNRQTKATCSNGSKKSKSSEKKKKSDEQYTIDHMNFRDIFQNPHRYADEDAFTPPSAPWLRISRSFFDESKILFDRLDTNGDQRLSKSELAKGLPKKGHSQWGRRGPESVMISFGCSQGRYDDTPDFSRVTGSVGTGACKPCVSPVNTGGTYPVDACFLFVRHFAEFVYLYQAERRMSAFAASFHPRGDLYSRGEQRDGVYLGGQEIRSLLQRMKKFSPSTP